MKVLTVLQQVIQLAQVQALYRMIGQTQQAIIKIGSRTQVQLTQAIPDQVATIAVAENTYIWNQVAVITKPQMFTLHRLK